MQPIVDKEREKLVMISERISDLRKEKNLSQGQLAEAVGVSRQAVSKWENGQSTPDAAKMILLAEILDTEVEYLATGIHPVYEPAPVVVNVVEKVDKVVEKVIEKPVIKKVVRVKYLRNPVEFALVGLGGALIGFLIGFLI